LTKLILGAISRRSQELAAIVEQTLTQDVRALLESLLTQEPLEGTSVPGKTSAYKLTLMKKSLTPRCFEMLQERGDAHGGEVFDGEFGGVAIFPSKKLQQEFDTIGLLGLKRAKRGRFAYFAPELTLIIKSTRAAPYPTPCPSRPAGGLVQTPR
jgi:hypothetical protein